MTSIRIAYNDRLTNPGDPDDDLAFGPNGALVLDEFVADDATTHSEAMDEACWWIAVYLKDGWSYRIHCGVMDYAGLDDKSRFPAFSYIDEVNFPIPQACREQPPAKPLTPSPSDDAAR